MATLKLTIIPEKAAKDGSHKIRVAIGHKSVTRYIVTNIKIDSVSQFKNGQIVKRPDASVLNTKLRNLLNAYQEKLDNIGNISIYDCKQLRQLLLNSTSSDEKATFQAVCRKYISELEEEGRRNYSILLERNCRYFTEYTKGEILLSDITPILIEGYARFLKVKKGIGDTTLGMMMSRTRTIINRGVKQQLAKYDVHPFLNYSIPSSPVREVDISLEAFNRIRPGNIKLVLAGDTDFEDDYSRGLKDMARRSGVVLTGFVKGRKLHSLLTHCRCYCLPSSHEGLPIALLEAMSYGVKVVVSNIPANKEVGLPPEDYFPVGDVDALAGKLEEIIRRPVTHFDYDMTKYDWEQIADQVAGIYISDKKS